MLRVFAILFIYIISFTTSFAQEFSYKNGDLLFQVGKGSDFENAIISATSGSENFNFTHIGIVYLENDSVFILEATPNQGVVKTDIVTFINKSSIVAVGRIKEQYQYTIPKALSKIKTLLGKPYDFVFKNNDDAYYCSELIQIAFITEEGNFLFETIPMSFKDNITGETNPYWIEYYKNYNEEIPEGEAGTNPIQLSKSDTIDIIYNMKF